VLRAVATDGHRLARVEMEPLPEGAAGMPGVIIPRKTVGELRKLAEETQDEIEFRLSDTKIRFRIGAVQLTSKLIDGTFPDYERVIPRGNDKVLTVGQEGLRRGRGPRRRHQLRAVAPGEALARPQPPAAHRRQRRAGPGAGGAGRRGRDLRASPLEIGFQARYLNDITDQVGDQVEFRFADGSAPTVVTDARSPRRSTC
jgi:DNA polymerase-3 subunit beta